MILPFSQAPMYRKPDDDKDICVNTLENADFIIPPGKYPIQRTFSPKFKKLLPLIEEVPDRDGIRIHQGAIPEHSTGCVLVDRDAQFDIDILFNRLEKFYSNEETFICITDDFGADGCDRL